MLNLEVRILSGLGCDCLKSDSTQFDISSPMKLLNFFLKD